MKLLFDEMNLTGVKLKNRVVRSATNERNLSCEKGKVNDIVLKYYENLSKGNVGLIITGYSNVLSDEMPSEKMLSISEDWHIEENKKIAEIVHKNGGKVFTQLVYGGSQTSNSPNTRIIFGPSAVENIYTKVVPKEMSKKDIKLVVEAFGRAAKRAVISGYDGIQIHGAHGYLLSQFMNPFYNKRNDEYGGSLENRARLIFEVYKEIRKVVGNNYPVGIKINCEDFMDEGSTFEDNFWVCKCLDEMGINFVEISGGSGSSRLNEGVIRPVKSKEHEGYFVKQADIIAKNLKCPIISVGGHRDLQTINEILNSTKIEYIAFSRPLIKEPNLVEKWMNSSEEKSTCISCSKCFLKTPCIFEGRKEK